MPVRPILERLGLLLFGVGVALGLGEVVARMAAPKAPAKGPSIDPAQSTEGWSLSDFARPQVRGLMATGALYRTNRHGFRGREYAARKPAGVFRVMIVGDSVTVGSGVEEYEAYPARLERRLNELQPGKPLTYEVLNLGVPGANIGVSARRLTGTVPRFDPDLIVYGWTVNDVEGPGYETTTPSPLERRKRIETIGRSIFARSALFRVVSKRWRSLREIVRPPSDSYVYELERNYLHDAGAWTHFTGELDRLAGIQEERGVCVLVFLHTQPYSLNFLYPFSAIHQRVAEAARDRGLLVIDSFDAHRGHAARSLWVSPSDPHPNPTGHRILSEALYEGLTQAPPRCWRDAS
jgi:lysophospholipase L1-like esterase